MKRLALVALCACGAHSTELTPTKVREETPPPAQSEVETQGGFGTLTPSENDDAVRALARRFAMAIVEENVTSMRSLLEGATWIQPAPSALRPLDEWQRRFTIFEYQALRPLLGKLSDPQIRALGSQRWEVRLPEVPPHPEAPLNGRVVLRVRGGDSLHIDEYGEQ